MTIDKVIHDLDQIGSDLERLVREAPHAVRKVFVETIDLDIGPESQQEVPVETGDLARSWTGAQVIVEESGKVIVEFGYGMNYAFWVHEIPPPGPGRARPKLLLPTKSKGAPKSKISGTRTARHRPPTKWKYLEHPMQRHSMAPMRDLREEFDRIFQGADY